MIGETHATYRLAGQTAIVDLQGRLTLSPSVNKIKWRLEKWLAAHPVTGLVLNLSGVPTIDSAGIGELMKIHAFATTRGMRLALAQVNPKVGELLKITRLDGLLAIYPTEASALEQIAKAQVAD